MKGRRDAGKVSNSLVADPGWRRAYCELLTYGNWHAGHWSMVKTKWRKNSPLKDLGTIYQRGRFVFFPVLITAFFWWSSTTVIPRGELDSRTAQVCEDSEAELNAEEKSKKAYRMHSRIWCYEPGRIQHPKWISSICKQTEWGPHAHKQKLDDSRQHVLLAYDRLNY